MLSHAWVILHRLYLIGNCSATTDKANGSNMIDGRERTAIRKTMTASKTCVSVSSSSNFTRTKEFHISKAMML